MKNQITSFILLLALILPVGALAYDFEVDGIYYNKNGTNATVTYQSYSDGAYSSDYGGDVIIPTTVTYGGTTYIVTTIGNSAFRNCSGLTGVTIPNSVTSIGNSAFSNCSGLTSVTIPNSVISIGNYAFYYCSGLTSVTIPNSVTSIGNSSFSYCSGLTSVSIPNSITSIGSEAFYACYSLTSITIPNSVISIGDWAFRGCRGLTSVTIPNSVTSIGNSAFEGCMGLTSIAIPNSVTSIGYSAFQGCSGLTSVTIGNSVTAIGNYAFKDCNGIKRVDITDILAWCKISFEGSYSNPLEYAHHLFLNGVEVKDLVIPNSVTTIGNNAFYYCSGLTSVSIPNSVTSIGWHAFSNCSGLTSVTIPNSVISIGGEAFYNCSGLTIVTIGNSVTSVGNYAFYGCSKLNTVIWNAANCTSIGYNGNNAFNYSLSSLQFGDGVEHIPTGLPSLSMSNKKLVLPNSVKTITSGAFKGNCSAVVIGNNIENVATATFPNGISVAYVTATEPLPCEAGAFLNPQTLYVPAGSKMKYFTSQGWGEFANIIEGTYVHASSITLNKSSVSMTKGNTYQLNATVLPTNASSSTITWVSTNPAVATVSSSGKITAVAVGETDIVAMVDNVRAVCHVTITPVLVESLTLSDTQLTLEPDEMYTLSATVYPASAENQTLEWIIPDNDVILTQVINNTRLNIGAVGSGSVTITVRTTDGSNLSATCTVNVQVVSTSISLNKTSANLSEGYTMQLRATVLPENATNNTVSWTTSNSSVATVDNNGLVTAVGPGAASITATTTDGSNLSASCVVTVISATDFIFHIDDFDGFAGSTVVIPIELDNNYDVRAFMFDFYYPEGFKVKSYTTTDRFTTESSVNGLNHPEGNYYRFTAINASTNSALSSGSGPILNIKLEIPDDASGDYELGLKGIQIVPQGSQVLFPDNISANLTVNIVLASSLQLDQSDVTLINGESMQLTATILPDETTNKTLNWESGDDSVISVDNNGLVTALAVGKTTVTATTTDGSNLSASCDVTVAEDLSNYDNYLSINDVETFPSETIVIPIAMTNTAAIVSFQTDIFLPEELELVREDGEYLIEPSDRMTRTHSIVCDDVSNGAVRVLCYSSNYKPFTGNSGDALFYITVKVSDDAVGDCIILLRNTLLTNSDFEEIVAPDVLANVKVKDYLLGDANNSGTVTVTDVVVTSQYVLEQNPQPFVFRAADVNADGNITVTDVSRIAWMVLNPTHNAPRQAPVLWNNGDHMSAEGISLTAGETRTVSITLDNEMDYSAFQLDLQLPDGLTASNFQLTDRASGHAFDVNTLQNGNIRALCYSPALKGINGHEGILLTFDVTAISNVNGDILVDGIELATTTCQTVKLDAFTIAVNAPSSVNEMANGKTIARVDYFNLAGQQLSEPRTGVNLVVTTYTDGTRNTTKLILQ